VKYNRGLGIGTAYAPNSRFIYLANTHFIVQVDLKAADIPASMDTVAVFDGFYDESPLKSCYFGLMQLMPNGIIYSPTIPYNHTRYLHEIRFPDRKGSACRPIQRSIRWPLTIGSVAYFPNYRLGPIDGSACDTLGINNLPLAHYRWDVEDTLAPLSVTFSDLSAYEPATWSWDFGDGSAVSQDTSPVHVFPAPGVYTVCLTVCNDYACDTLCREVTVGFSSTASPEQAAAGIVLYPNPASSSFTLQKAEGVFPQGARVALYNSTGQLMQERRAAGGETSMVFSWEQYPAGVYWLRVDMPDAGTLVRKAIKKG
jgi:PKD repeat protein